LAKLGGVVLFSVETHIARSEFCMSCLIMQKPYRSLEDSVHAEKEVACVEYHYAPGLHWQPLILNDELLNPVGRKDLT
jgi:hypothetical protein